MKIKRKRKKKVTCITIMPHVSRICGGDGETLRTPPWKQGFGHQIALHASFEPNGYYSRAFSLFFLLVYKITLLPLMTPNYQMLMTKKPTLSKAKIFTFQEQ
jgi:hypothetical protein